MDLNLDTLQREIIDHLEEFGLGVFYISPGGLEGQTMVLWDTERYPDYRLFLDAARRSGASLILFASRELESGDIDELADQVEDCELTREEQREIERRLSGMRVFEGRTCGLEMAFDYHSRLYVFEVHPEWYDEFLEIEEEIAAHLPEDTGEGDSLGGPYFSRN